jgi:hypothetical protein
MADDDKHDCDCGDEIMIGPELSNGTRPALRHTADHEIVTGFVRQVKDGEPLPEDAMLVERIEGCRYSWNTTARRAPRPRSTAKAGIGSSGASKRLDWPSSSV